MSTEKEVDAASKTSKRVRKTNLLVSKVIWYHPVSMRNFEAMTDNELANLQLCGPDELGSVRYLLHCCGVGSSRRCRSVCRTFESYMCISQLIDIAQWT
jgi:hypothetical protein